MDLKDMSTHIQYMSSEILLSPFKKEILLLITTCIKLEVIMLRKISQRKISTETTSVPYGILGG
jgi:hypothetical protein